jgi:L-fuculose-phosphate aldolase
LQSIQTLRRNIVEYGKHLYNRNYIGGTEGNISVRLGNSKVLITPTGKNLGLLKPSELVMLSARGKKLSGKLLPSSEYKLHLAIYTHRHDVKAICHAHPLYATAYAVAGLAMDKLILPEVIMTFGTIPLIEYGTPGTLELFEKMCCKIKNHDALLMKNHGVLTVGKDLEDAFNKMEIVERYARILLIASLIGKPSVIPKEMAEKIPGFERIESQLLEGEYGGECKQ